MLYFDQGIMVLTGTGARQFFFCMSVMAKKLKGCLLLSKIEQLLVLDVCLLRQSFKMDCRSVATHPSKR